MISFESFYKRVGFKEYPFASFSAESERQQLRELFVRPAIHSPLVETFTKRSTVILSGERGTGKTALTYDLMSVVRDDVLQIYVDDFSSLAIPPTSNDLYQFLIDHFTEELFARLASKPWAIWRLEHEQKLLLAYLLKFHVSDVSADRIRERIRKVRVSPLRRFAIAGYNGIRGVLNYGASAAVDISADFVRRHLPGLPPLEQGVTREYFPRLRGEPVDDLSLTKCNFSLLSKCSRLAVHCGFEKVLFVLDKIDEEARLENDAANIAEFLNPLLTDNKLLLHDSIQLLIACWSIPLEQLRSVVRFQKLSLQRVVWTNLELVDVLDKRLQQFSGGVVAGFKSLIGAGVDQANASRFIALANGNPRDLWHLMDAAMKSQFNLDSTATALSTEALEAGSRDFVSSFNFFEYYPRNGKARATTMDVYSYITHLQKLESPQFTKNQLSDRAGTGGSTSNYVVAMENMGLIVKTDEKGDSGAVIYQVRDPKVVFAMAHGILINRSGG